jgi:hypothetical protein
MSVDSQVIEHSGEYTIINESFTSDFNMISEYKFLLSPIEHTIHKDSDRYTAHTYIENAKEDNNLLKMRFYPQQIRKIIQYLVDNGVNMMYVENNIIYNINPTKK